MEGTQEPVRNLQNWWRKGKTNQAFAFLSRVNCIGSQRSLACCSPWGRKELDMTE